METPHLPKIHHAKDNRIDDDGRQHREHHFIGAAYCRYLQVIFARFYLPVEPEASNSSYGQLIVNVKNYDDIDGILAESIDLNDPSSTGFWFYAGTSQATAVNGLPCTALPSPSEWNSPFL